MSSRVDIISAKEPNEDRKELDLYSECNAFTDFDEVAVNDILASLMSFK